MIESVRASIKRFAIAALAAGTLADLAHAGTLTSASLAIPVNVPEPSSLFLLAAGLIGIGVVALRRK